MAGTLDGEGAMKRVGLAIAAALALTTAAQAAEPGVYLGADLSFVNEMEDCGGAYRENGKAVDPFELMARKGGNLKAETRQALELGTVQELRREAEAILALLEGREPAADR